MWRSAGSTGGEDKVETWKGNGRAYPSRPIVGVAAAVFDRERVLLVRRCKEPARGQWSFPGGAVKVGETLVDALRREVREELSIEISVGGVLGIFDRIYPDSAGRIAYHYILIDFWADLSSGVPAPGSDVDALQRVSPAESGLLGLDATLKAAILRAAELRAAGRNAFDPGGGLL